MINDKAKPLISMVDSAIVIANRANLQGPRRHVHSLCLARPDRFGPS